MLELEQEHEQAPVKTVLSLCQQQIHHYQFQVKVTLQGQDWDRDDGDDDGGDDGECVAWEQEMGILSPQENAAI